MKAHKKFGMPAIVILLSLGFFSQPPVNERTPRRISSTDCVNCAKDSVPMTSLTATSPSLTPYFLSVAAQQSNAEINFLSQQLDFHSRMNAIGRSDFWGYMNPLFYVQSPLPNFPNYALPLLANYQVDLQKPVSNNQIFGGLSTAPALQYLVKPLEKSVPIATSAPAVAPLQHNVVLDIREPVQKSESEKAANGLSPSPNAIGTSIPSTSLLGSVPVKKADVPSVSFSNAN